MIGKFGTAKLGLTVKKVDQFSGTCVVTVYDVNNSLLFQLWTALCFCPRSNVKLTIVDYT